MVQWGSWAHTHTGEPPSSRYVERVEMQGPYGALQNGQPCNLGLRQEPFAGRGLRGSITENVQHNNQEMQREADFFKLLQRPHGLGPDTIGWSRLSGYCEKDTTTGEMEDARLRDDLGRLDGTECHSEGPPNQETH